MDFSWSDGTLERRREKHRTMTRTLTSASSWSPSSSGPLSKSASSLLDQRPHTVGCLNELKSSSSAPQLAGGRQATSLQKGSNLRLAAFLDRQLNHPTLEARRNVASLQKRTIVEQFDGDKSLGNKGVQGFRTYLKRQFGSVVAGWRALDTDGNGRLSFYEFCNSCRAMGYQGNLRKLWRQLDFNGNGFVSLMEIDEEVGKTVGMFKLALLKKYGDMVSAWQNGIDINGNGRVEEHEIETVIDNLNLDINPKTLFSYLRVSGGGLGLTLHDFDPEAHKRLITGDLKGLTMKQSEGWMKEFLEDNPGLASSLPASMIDGMNQRPGGGARRFRKELVLADQKEVLDHIAENVKMKQGIHSVEGFKTGLVHRFGSLFQAWRELDLDGNGRLTSAEFHIALHRLGLFGDIKGLWKDLDVNGMGYLSFADMDKDMDSAVNDLKEKLLNSYGNMMMAWAKGIDLKGEDLVDEAAFVSGLKSVGYKGINGIDAKKLFHAMKPEGGRKYMSLRDFDLKAYMALHIGDFRMIVENQENSKNSKELDFLERQQSGMKCQMQRAWKVAQQPEFARLCGLTTTHDPIADNKFEEQSFEELLRRKYGTIIGAWRRFLDAEQSGRLSFQAFCRVVRLLGYKKDLTSLYNYYDVDKKGYIQLKDLDPDADDLVTSFTTLLTERFGNLEQGWRKGFKKDPHEKVNPTELAEACESLGYPHNARKLFKCLQPTPATPYITIWDLDPVQSRIRAQGRNVEQDESLNAASPTSPSNAPKSPSNEPKSPAVDDKRSNVYAPVVDEKRSNVYAQAADVIPSAASMSIPDTSSPSSSYVSEDLRLLHCALKTTHGSTVGAWRAHFDPDLTGSVSYGKFVIVIEDCTYHGNKKSLWEELAEKGQSDSRVPIKARSITFNTLDPETANLLDDFRKFLVSSSGSLVKAWRECIDRDGMGKVDAEEFCGSLAGRIKNPKKIFRLLLGRQGQRSLSLKDLETLLILVPKAERQVIWRVQSGDAEQARPGTSPAVGGHGRSEGSMPSTRQYTDMMIEKHHAADGICTDLASFKKILVAKYGSIFASWRRALDVDQNGVVTHRNFAAACQRLGVKAVHKIWAEFDKNKDGQISLNELDPESAQLFNALEQLLIEMHGSTKEGWRKVFDRKNCRRCSGENFVEQCQAIGFPGDARKLFTLLKPECGRSVLAFEDLWINVNVNDYVLTRPEPNTTQGSPRSTRTMSPQSTLRPQSQGAMSFMSGSH